MKKHSWLVLLFAALLLAAGGLWYFARLPGDRVPSTTGAGSDLVDRLKENTAPIAEFPETYLYADGKRATGFLAQPAVGGPFPAVIVIHEWWGLNDNIKEMARALAREGYVALAVDLFGGAVATTPEEARTLTGSVSREEALANLEGALAHLAALESVRSDRIASLGWCYGGGQSFRLGLAEPGRLAATVVYYGQVTDDAAELSVLRQPMLGIFGAEDQSIPADLVRRFDAALTEIGAEHEVRIYPGAGHAFANPTNSAAYRPEAAADAWERTTAFLEKYLKR